MTVRGPRRLAPTIPLETERLLLRAFAPGDFEAVFAIYSRPDVVRWLYQETRTEAEVRELLQDKARSRSIDKEDDKLAVAVALKPTMEVVGDCVLQWTNVRHRQGEVGFVFHPTTMAGATRRKRPPCCSGWRSRSSGCTACTGGPSRGTRRRPG